MMHIVIPYAEAWTIGAYQSDSSFWAQIIQGVAALTIPTFYFTTDPVW